MNTKKIITVVLLLFVIVSVVFFLAKEFTPKHAANSLSKTEPYITQGLLVDSSSQDTIQDATARGINPGTGKFVVYYFHRTVRCPTCIKLEEYSNEAIKSGFADEIQKGRLEWKSINIEDAGNEHYEDDYKLYSQSLVLVELQNARQQRWKNLEKIWELVSTKEAYFHYVQHEVKTFLEGNS